MSVDEDSRPGQLTYQQTTIMSSICSMMCTNYHLVVWKIAERVGVSKGFRPINCICILSLPNHATFVDWIKKKTVLKSIRNYLPMQMVKETFLRTWQETKSKWHNHSGWKKSFFDQKSMHKLDEVMSHLYFDWKGTVYYALVQHGQMANKNLYKEILMHLTDPVCRNRPELW